MSLSRQMRQAARRAASRLRESAGELVRFIRSQLNDDAGFADRSGRSDLYYTAFGLESLAALDALPPIEPTGLYLRQFVDRIEQLDLIHLGCLVRCHDCLSEAARPILEPGDRPRVLRRLEAYRSADGGFNQFAGAANGSAYGCLLALGLCQDLAAEPPARSDLLACLRRLKNPDGGYSNEPNQMSGQTPATAAAATILAELGEPPDRQAVRWLLDRYQPAGGFAALPILPMADLLSTATALHALSRAGADVAPFGDACARFVATLRVGQGGFRGHPADEQADCEYTFYGLLALGHLSG